MKLGPVGHLCQFDLCVVLQQLVEIQLIFVHADPDCALGDSDRFAESVCRCSQNKYILFCFLLSRDSMLIALCRRKRLDEKVNPCKRQGRGRQETKDVQWEPA